MNNVKTYIHVGDLLRVINEKKKTSEITEMYKELNKLNINPTSLYMKNEKDKLIVDSKYFLFFALRHGIRTETL